MQNHTHIGERPYLEMTLRVMYSCTLFIESHLVQEHTYLCSYVVAQKLFYRLERMGSCLIHVAIVDLETMLNFQWICKLLYLT